MKKYDKNKQNKRVKKETKLKRDANIKNNKNYGTNGKTKNKINACIMQNKQHIRRLVFKAK